MIRRRNRLIPKRAVLSGYPQVRDKPMSNLLRTLFYIATGGALGACARYLFSHAVSKTFANVQHFPIGIFVTNLVGCLLIGVIAGLVQSRSWISPALRTFLVIGFLGAFTTFSTFSHDNLLLLQKGAMLSFLINAVGQVVLGLMLVSAGYYVTTI